MKDKKWINLTVGILIILLIIIVALANNIIQDQKKIIETQKEKPITYQNTQDTKEIGFEILNLINIARTARELPELKYSPILSNAGENHCKDIIEYGYWEHNREGKMFDDFVKELGVEYQIVGEVLAKDFNNTGEIVDGWLKSEKHKEVILGEFNEVGVGVIKQDDGLLVSVYFIKK